MKFCVQAAERDVHVVWLMLPIRTSGCICMNAPASISSTLQFPRKATEVPP